jgi:hypothetical protein
MTASPKHPQSDTGFVSARIKVRTVKKVMKNSSTQYVLFFRYPKIKTIPRTSSKAARNIASGSASLSKKDIPKA